MLFLPPTDKTILAPEEGWKPNSWYIVEISFGTVNPVHRSMFYSGFLNGENKTPGAYNMLTNPSYEGGIFVIEDVHYLKPIEIVAYENSEHILVASPPANPRSSAV